MAGVLCGATFTHLGGVGGGQPGRGDVTHTARMAAPAASWGTGLLGSTTPDTSPRARVERYKLYSTALSGTRVAEERSSLAPFSTTNLFHYNSFVTTSYYAGTHGSNPLMWREQGGRDFSNTGQFYAGGGGTHPSRTMHGDQGRR